MPGRHRIALSDSLAFLQGTPADSVDLIYVDPPFNTKKTQRRTRVKTTQSESGDRSGFKGRRYETITLGAKAFADQFDDYLGFIGPRLREAHRVLAPHGTLYFHIDYREAHYCKVLLDAVFGRECFLNEIIWAYDFGGRGKRRWPAKHDTILVYVRDPETYTFNWGAIGRIPYMAPGLQTAERASRGKVPTDVWWHTIVGTNSREKTGYPTQKPLGILRRVVQASSNPGDLVLDFFAGSGTTGAACLELGRRFVLVDDNPEAIDVMRRRFADNAEEIEWVNC